MAIAKVKQVFLLVMFAFCCRPLFANTALQIGFIERPPHIYANADGSIRGLTGKNLVTLFKQAEVDADLIRTYQEDIGTFISLPQLNGFIATKTLIDNPNEYIFSAKPLFTLQFYAYHLDKTPYLNDLSELKNTTISLPIPLETFAGPLKQQIMTLENNVTVIADSSNLETQIMLLRKGRTQYGISYLGKDNIAMMFSNRTRNNNIVVSDLFELPMFLVLERSAHNAEIAIKKINAVLDATLR